MTHPRLALDRAPRYAARPRLASDQSSQREYTEDGHLRVHRTVLTEARVNDYLGGEIPDWQSLRLDPNQRYPLLRDPDELAKAVKTFEALPLTNGHRPVSSDDHPFNITVGATGDNAEFSFPYLTNSLVVWSQIAIDAIEAGNDAVSCAYRYTPIMEPGIFRGQRFAGRMIAIIGNHCAIVDAPRVSSAIIADRLPREFRR